MPKIEIFHQAGKPISEDIKEIIENYFSEKERNKLERLGGRVLISIASPYKKKNKDKFVIDDNFIENLKKNRKDSDQLKIILDKLLTKQLREICKKINQPVRSNDKAEEIKREIIRALQAKDYWESISKG